MVFILKKIMKQNNSDVKIIKTSGKQLIKEVKKCSIITISKQY